MQARRQTASSNASENTICRRRPGSLQLGVSTRGYPTLSSPLARYSSTAVNERARRESNEPTAAARRKSVCQLIPEELGGLTSDLPASLHNHIDISSELLKRHHKPKPSPIRTVSDPQIVSTNTTQPVHIPNANTMATLAPRTDSLSARVRGSSHIDFKTATTGVAAKAMRNEISRLVNTVEDPATKKAFDTEMQSFFYLFTRYLSERAQNVDLDWDRIKSPADDQIIPYDTLSEPKDRSNLNKLAVLKVNGGLGTSMGMTGAKSALEVKDDMTFLDLTVRQIEHLNMTNRVDVPLILMTSFNTHEDTLRIIKKYANQQAEFLMEVTDKTKADIKGGTLIDYDGSIRLLEIAQVPSEHVEDFKSVRKFKIFNTNNLWINLRGLFEARHGK
ncbi:hypothetical protein ID866_4146 [Astraeus odoratus]|nr:hypothetical protein ID866_4146 [Astraeus odoratus]